MSTTTHLQAADDNRHALEPPLGRESLALVMPLPDEQLGLIAYTFVDHQDTAGCALMLWGPDGIIVGDRSDPVQAAGMDFDDWKIAGLELVHREPLRTFDLTYKSDRLDLDLTFDARHAAYAYGEHPHGCPDWLATDRFEQHGDLRGTLRVDGRTISLDGRKLFRDHSWGARDWQGPQHWKWIHLAAGDSSVHVMEVWHRGRRDTPGYVYRDGRLAAITEFTVDHLDFGPDFFHRSISATIIDEAGRKTAISASTVATTAFPAHEAIRLHEATATCEIAGESGDGHVEMLWTADYVEHHAS